MSSAGPGAGRGPEAGNVSSSGVGSSSFGSVGDNATFKWELKRPLTHVAWLPVSACLVIAATIVFAVFAVAQWPGGPQIQYVWFYVLAALALLVAGAAALYPAGRTGQIRDAAQQAADTRRLRMVRAILVAGRDARGDGRSAQARQGAWTPRIDAEPEDRNGHGRHGQGGAGSEGGHVLDQRSADG